MASGSASSSERALSWLLLLLALAGVAWLVTRPKAPAARAPAGDTALRVPAGAELLLTADVEALAKAAAPELLAAGAQQLLGLHEDCGFEPLLELRRVAFAIPAGQAEVAHDFALIAETTLKQEPLLRCAEKLIRKRGGRPVRSELGRFRGVRDQAKPGGEVAVRGDGLLVLSGGGYFRDVLDANSGVAAPDEAAKLREAMHGAVRRRLGPAQLMLTVLPGRLLPLPEVQALGLAIRVEEQLGLAGFVACGKPETCRQALQLVEQIKADLTREPGLEAMAKLTIAERDAGLELGAQLPRESLVPLLRQLLAP
jgi:hypothetical protein